MAGQVDKLKTRGETMKKTKVLVADDNAELLSSLEIQLLVHGYDVVICSNADLAVAYAQKHGPDVMIVDIWMDTDRRLVLSKAGNGLGVLERITEFPQTKGIPVIHITGGDSPQLDLRAKVLGAYGLIRKPIDFNALIKMIEAAVKEHPCCSSADPGCETECDREVAASTGGGASEVA
jgi:CheY-like chemotaxis protein